MGALCILAHIYVMSKAIIPALPAPVALPSDSMHTSAAAQAGRRNIGTVCEAAWQHQQSGFTFGAQGV